MTKINRSQQHKTGQHIVMKWEFYNDKGLLLNTGYDIIDPLIMKTVKTFDNYEDAHYYAEYGVDPR